MYPKFVAEGQQEDRQGAVNSFPTRCVEQTHPPCIYTRPSKAVKSGDRRPAHGASIFMCGVCGPGGRIGTRQVPGRGATLTDSQVWRSARTHRVGEARERRTRRSDAAGPSAARSARPPRRVRSAEHSRRRASGESRHRPGPTAISRTSPQRSRDDHVRVSPRLLSEKLWLGWLMEMNGALTPHLDADEDVKGPARPATGRGGAPFPTGQRSTAGTRDASATAA
jgi:hypothetical protein